MYLFFFFFFILFFFFFQAEDGIRDHCVTGVQTCALPISSPILCNNNGYSKHKSDSCSGFYGSGGSYHEFNQSNNDTSNLVIDTRHTSYSSASLYLNNHRTGSSAFMFADFLSGNNGDVEFRFRGDGQAYADGSWNGGGADYAEYFEWADGNSSNQDRTGYTVVLDNEKVRLATSDDNAANIIGAVSANPQLSVIVILNSGNTNIKEMILVVLFGKHILLLNGLKQW